jgi:hypothetical protein
MEVFMKSRCILVLAAALAGAGAQEREQSPEALFKQAVQLESVDGDLGAAIKLYNRISQGADKALAAKSLLRLAQCYERLGGSRAKQVYERIVRQFPTQSPEADRARQWLAAKPAAAPRLRRRASCFGRSPFPDASL